MGPNLNHHISIITQMLKRHYFAVVSITTFFNLELCVLSLLGAGHISLDNGLYYSQAFAGVPAL